MATYLCKIGKLKPGGLEPDMKSFMRFEYPPEQEVDGDIHDVFNLLTGVARNGN